MIVTRLFVGLFAVLATATSALAEPKLLACHSQLQSRTEITPAALSLDEVSKTVAWNSGAYRLNVDGTEYGSSVTSTSNAEYTDASVDFELDGWSFTLNRYTGQLIQRSTRNPSDYYTWQCQLQQKQF